MTISGSGDIVDFGGYDSVPWKGVRTAVETLKFNADEGKSFTKIGNYAFAESYLNQAILFLGIEYIGDYCFKNTLLTTLHIPGTIKFIGDGAFQNDLLKNITVGPNDKYFIDDGHLLGKIDNDNYELLYFNNLITSQ